MQERPDVLREPVPPFRRRPRIFREMEQALQARRYSKRTAIAYLGWVERFLQFHGRRHPRQLGEPQISEFLTHLATELRVSPSTQNQALAAILFLFRVVLRRDLGLLKDVVRAKVPKRLPIVLSRSEVQRVLAELRGPHWIMGTILYGAGLRVLECVRLRVHALDFHSNRIMIRGGKGNKDRWVPLPRRVQDPLQEHLERTRAQHRRDIEEGAGAVVLPGALRRKFPNAEKEWAWQWVFPATRHYLDPETGQYRRHHYHETALQRAVKAAVNRSGINKPASCHTFRHYPERRIIPSRGARLLRRPCLSLWEWWRTRDNHSASRNCSRASSGR